MGEHLVECQKVSHLAILEQDDAGSVDAVVKVVLGADQSVVELNGFGVCLACLGAVARLVVRHSLKSVKPRVLRIYPVQGVEAWIQVLEVMAAHQCVNTHSGLKAFLLGFLLPVVSRLAQQQGEQQRAHHEKECLDSLCYHRFMF